MKRLRWPILLLLALFGPLLILAQPTNSAGVAPIEISDSPNKKFRVVIESVTSPASELQASMVKMDGASPVTQWVIRLPFFRRPIPSPNTFVSDKGDFFVRLTSWTGDITIFHRDGSKAVIQENSAFASMLYTLDNRMPAIEILRGEEVLRLWEPERNRWGAYSTKEGAKFHPSHEDIQRWNEATRFAILEKLYAAKRKEIQQKAMDISPPIARLAGRIATNLPLPSYADYLFLATVKNPEDRKWFEELLGKNSPLTAARRIQFLRGDALPYTFELTQNDRAGADYLLAYFDKKASGEERSLHWQFENYTGDTRYTLGQVTGTIRLPMPMPIYKNSTQATLLHIRLIRAEDADKKQSAANEERIAGTIGYERARDRRKVYNVKFAFTTVLPGAYRVKAVWDKRSPHSDTNNAGPGDYETILSAPITVTAGATITNLLHCTNRIPGGEAYYAADQIVERQWLADNPAAPTQ